jgi:hypothetical protein
LQPVHTPLLFMRNATMAASVGKARSSSQRCVRVCRCFIKALAPGGVYATFHATHVSCAPSSDADGANGAHWHFCSDALAAAGRTQRHSASAKEDCRSATSTTIKTAGSSSSASVVLGARRISRAFFQNSSRKCAHHCGRGLA